MSLLEGTQPSSSPRQQNANQQAVFGPHSFPHTIARGELCATRGGHVHLTRTHSYMFRPQGPGPQGF